MRALDIKFRSCIVFFFMLSFGFSNGYAQYNPMPVITKPSSEALSIEKFGEIPVDLFSGRVNITIPLYTAKQYDVAVPISLSYHGGGVKVTEDDAPVGLGWTLQCGGVITRSIRGLPDELCDLTNKALGYDQMGTSIYAGNYIEDHDSRRKEFVEMIKQRIYDYIPLDLFNYNLSDYECKLGYLTEIYGEQYDKGNFDTAQDTYSFNIMGMSGVFVRNRDQSDSQFIIQTDNGVKISYDKHQEKFEITDVQGYVYEFAQVEYSMFRYQTQYSWTDYLPKEQKEKTFNCPSAWWLSSITSPSGEIVTFNYRVSEIHEKPDLRPMFFSYEKYQQATMTWTRIHGGSSPDTTKNVRYVPELSSIVAKNSTVNFIYNGRSDFRTSILKELTVMSNSGDRKKKIILDYSPFETLNSESERLKLDSISECGEDDTDPKKYTFKYIEEINGISEPLADKNSSSRDHWGYAALEYGGIYPSPVNYFGDYVYDVGYVNRNSDAKGAIAGMLESITYPTGGVSELAWEPNTFSELGIAAMQAVASDNSFFENLEGATKKEKVITASGEQKNLSANFSIDSKQAVKIDLSGYYNGYFPKGDPSWERCIYGWNSSDTADLSIHLPYLEFATSDQSYKRIVRVNKSSIEDGATILLPQGSYTVTLRNPRRELGQCSDAECQEFYYRCKDGIDASYGTVKISYFTYLKNNYIAGGCRIQRITNCSGNDTIVKLYNYSLDGMDPKSPSSGVLTLLPRYGSNILKRHTITVYEETPWETTTNIYYINSSPLPNTLNGGSHIEYSTVTESLIRNGHLDPNDPERGDVHLIKYKYCTSNDSYCSDIDDTKYGTAIPSCQMMLTSKNYQRGHLKWKLENGIENATTTYTYQVHEKLDVDTITGSLFTVADFTESYKSLNCGSYGTIHPYKDFGIVKYRVIPYNKRLVEEKTEGDFTQKYTKNTYSNPNEYSSNMLCNSPTSVSSIDSEGDTITEYYTYTSMNRVNTCVTAKKGYIIKAYRVQYDDKNQITAKYTADIDPNSPPLASGYQLGQNLTITNNSHPIYLLTNSLEETYLYDNNRLVEVKNQKTNSPTTYLWSYNGDHPVAEIRNAAFNEVVSQLGMENIANIFHSLNPDKSAIDQMRNTMPQWFVTTITYKLLTGISSITDPKGTVSTFEYDSSGNLKNIKDHNNKLLQTIYVKYIGEYL